MKVFGRENAGGGVVKWEKSHSEGRGGIMGDVEYGSIGVVGRRL